MPTIPGTEALVHGTEAIIPGANALVPGTEAIIPGTDALVPGTEAIILGTKALVPGTEAIIPGTKAIILGTDASIHGSDRKFVVLWQESSGATLSFRLKDLRSGTVCTAFSVGRSVGRRVQARNFCERYFPT